MTHIFGLDLSMDNTGVTIFDSDYNPIHITSISTNKKHTHGKRLYVIAQELLKLKDQYPPCVIAIERGFSRFNTSTQVIYRVHGLINYLFHDVEQVYYPPKKVKEAIIRGDASKARVREVIESKYPEVKFDNEDESDSFAIGITYLIENKLISWSKSSVKKK
jgi:Holliday junction resolvasome RuvABC endonuclease subunit